MIKNIKFLVASLGSIAVLSGTSVTNAQTFDIESVGDFGGAHPNFPASNTVDGNTAFASRWAANYEDAGGEVNLFVDLGSVQRVDDIGVAWGAGNQRSYNFEVRARAGTSGTWTKIRDRGDSSGSTTAIETYSVTDFDARQVRIKVFSTEFNRAYADVTEFEVYGTNGSSGSNSSSSSSSSTSSSSSSSSSGGSINVPGLIEAEDYTDYSDADTANRGGAYRTDGVDIQACGDTGCGFNVGWTADGEWLEYDIDVARSGNYEARVRLASPSGAGEFSIDVNGSDRTGDVEVDSTGNWQRYYTETIDIGSLSSGNQTIRLNVVDSGFNLNWIEIVESDDSSSSSSSSSSSTTTSSSSTGGSGQFNLDPSAPPWENFDLSQWRLDTPASRSSDSDDECRTQQTDPEEYADSSLDRSDSEEYFFTHTDGGMRFVTEVGQATTGNNCDSRTRSELREMLRGTNTSISDDGDNGDFRNNWALGYQPQTADADFTWGARGGRMEATLRVNQVTTQGASSNIGRTVIGQIHASDDEPLRLNYKHREGFEGGCIYASSEQNGGDDTNYVLVGDGTSCNNDPGSDGIALGELFSYVIENINEDIIVTIIRGDRDGEEINSVRIDLNEIDAGYDRNDEWNYFKAGAYTQNDSSSNARNGDSDIVTFYRLDVTH